MESKRFNVYMEIDKIDKIDKKWKKLGFSSRNAYILSLIENPHWVEEIIDKLDKLLKK
jgi:hypothetical protein